jgi:hypothetical protein
MKWENSHLETQHKIRRVYERWVGKNTFLLGGRIYVRY